MSRSLTFDTEDTGSIFIQGGRETVLLFSGRAIEADRAACRIAKRTYELGRLHKELEVKEALGIK